MKFKKGFILVFSIIFVAILVTGCAKADKQSAQTSEGPNSTVKTEIKDISLDATVGEEKSVQVNEVIASIGYDISTLSPWLSASAGRLAVFPTIYEYMAYYDSTQECGMSGILMKDYKKVDSLTSRVSIYDYIYDSAGNHFTASDVAFCFNEWKKNGKSVKCKLLDKVVVVDEYTVDIIMAKDTVGDVENMLCGLIPMVTQKAYEESGDTMIEKVVSTSPYILKEYVSGSYLALEKNPNYWQKDDSEILATSKSNADKIRFNIITEGFQVPINLETNTIDITSPMSYNDAKRFETKAGYNVNGIKDSNFYWITFNCAPGVGIFDNNVALRQAMAYAIDAEGLIKGVLGGAGEVVRAYGMDVCVDYNPEWSKRPYYDYDLDKAKQLLKESGFDTSKTIRICTPSGTVPKNAAQVVQSYLIQLGLKVEINAYDSAIFQQYKTDNTQWDIMLDSKMSVDYVTSLASTLQVSGATQALNFVVDEKLQKMTESVQTTTGHTKEALDEYMNYVSDNCYVYSLFVPYNYYVCEEGITKIFANFKGWLVPGACIFSDNYKR